MINIFFVHKFSPLPWVSTRSTTTGIHSKKGRYTRKFTLRLVSLKTYQALSTTILKGYETVSAYLFYLSNILRDLKLVCKKKTNILHSPRSAQLVIAIEVFWLSDNFLFMNIKNYISFWIVYTYKKLVYTPVFVSIKKKKKAAFIHILRSANYARTVLLCGAIW